jgi:hypothetical protein
MTAIKDLPERRKFFFSGDLFFDIVKEEYAK